MTDEAMERLLERAGELMDSHVYPLEETVMAKGWEGSADERAAARALAAAAHLLQHAGGLVLSRRFRGAP